MVPFSYHAPADVNAAVSLLANNWDDAVVLAGGTDLLDQLKERILRPQKVVSLKHIAALQGVKTSAANVSIGAMTTLAEVESNPTLAKNFTVLAQAAHSVASPQIRNVGTLGGNICQRPRCWFYRMSEYPCLKKGGTICYAVGGNNKFHAIFGGGPAFIVHPSDTAPALVALDAKVTVQPAMGAARTIPLAAFFVLPQDNVLRENNLKPNEVVTALTLPNPKPGTKSVYLKSREKQSEDFAVASVAMSVTTNSAGIVQDCRVVLGSVAPIPWRAQAAEAALKGKKLSEAVANAAGIAAVQGAQPMEHNAYKVPLVQGLIRQAVYQLMA